MGNRINQLYNVKDVQCTYRTLRNFVDGDFFNNDELTFQEYIEYNNVYIHRIQK